MANAYHDGFFSIIHNFLLSQSDVKFFELLATLSRMEQTLLLKLIWIQVSFYENGQDQHFKHIWYVHQICQFFLILILSERGPSN